MGPFGPNESPGTHAWSLGSPTAAVEPSTVKQLLSEDQIRVGVERLADEVGSFYAGRPLTILGVLTGSLVLVADLIRDAFV